MRITGAKALVAVLLTSADVCAQFWYGPGGVVPLREDSSRIVIKFEVQLSWDDIGAILEDFPAIGTKLQNDRVLDGFSAFEVTTPLTSEQLTRLRTTEGIYLAEPCYLDDQDSAFIIGESFVVAFDGNFTGDQINEVVVPFHVVVDREIPGMHNVFLIRNTPGSGSGLLEIANAFHDLVSTRWAEPNFIPRLELYSYRVWDDYYVLQNHIKRVVGTINERSVWDFAGLMGPTDSVVVAVLDDGVTDHVFDLPSSKILPGYDFCTGIEGAMRDEDPTPGTSSAHGMACAGIIASTHATDSVLAVETWDGVIGMNPTTRVLPVKIYPDTTSGVRCTIADYAEAITWAWQHGADVLSNSWGWLTTPSGASVLNEALSNAVVQGRGSKGCSVFFASGNAGLLGYSVGYPAYLPYVMAVGSVDTLENLLPYTQRGDSLDLTAPSGHTGLHGDVWTIDQMYQYGYNPTYGQYDPKYPWPWDCQLPEWGLNNENYNCRMGGTSAACPVAAGAASLLLARDPELLARDTTSDSSSDYNVYDILCKSAKPLGGAVPNGAYGWGRVDAYRAILSIARGDVNNSADISMGDVTYLIDHLFGSGVPIFPDSLLGDVTCDGALSIGDINLLIDHLFISLDPLPLPCFEFNN
ncbi:MAG: S8 family serine peptidase [Candidatus Zixiibacteriota bacterium]